MAQTDHFSQENKALKALVQSQAQHIALLEEKLRLALHKQFAAKSEKTSPDEPEAQLNMFNEAEQTAPEEAEAEPETPRTTVGEHRCKKPGRRPLPDHIPRTRSEERR